MSSHDHEKNDPRYAKAQLWEARLTIPIIIAALLAIPVTALHFMNVSETVHHIANYTMWGIWIMFVAEIAIMTRVHPEPISWLRHHWLPLLIVVVSFPPLTDAAGAWLRLLRLTKLMKTLKLIKLGKIGKMWKVEKIARTRGGFAGTRLRAVQVVTVVLAIGVLLATIGFIKEPEKHGGEHEGTHAAQSQHKTTHAPSHEGTTHTPAPSHNEH